MNLSSAAIVPWEFIVCHLTKFVCFYNVTDRIFHSASEASCDRNKNLHRVMAIVAGQVNSDNLDIVQALSNYYVNRHFFLCKLMKWKKIIRIHFQIIMLFVRVEKHLPLHPTNFIRSLSHFLRLHFIGRFCFSILMLCAEEGQVNNNMNERWMTKKKTFIHKTHSPAISIWHWHLRQ